MPVFTSAEGRNAIDKTVNKIYIIYMRKKAVTGLFLILTVVMLAAVVSGCVDKYGVPDGYVEVESLRTDQANVALSPAGDTSTFQTNIEILPANATNRKLVYYVPSEYKGYVQVSDTGLITAVQLTPEGESVPVKVYSSSNPNAYLTINVVVEYVEVKEITFTEEKISLLYNSEGVTVTPVFAPSHAQDGRAVTFSSLNSNVATVDSTGLVTPVSAGNTHILAVGRTSSGKEITGRIPVVVTYAAGRYRLEVSDSAPQYEQVIGQFKPINFNLMVLDEHSDPNVFIQWYVDSERVVGMDNQPQYQHIPSVSTRTSYRVSAVVSTRMEEPKTYYSELITIHNPFNGYTYNYGNLTSGGYQYGDVVTFELTEGSDDIAEYRWYLSKAGENTSLFVGTTLPSARNLTRRLNIEGNFVLKAEGVSVNGTVISSREFNFGVTRFFVGDTLLIDTLLIDDGIPPESYNFYIAAFSDDSEREDDFALYDYLSAALQGETFRYHLASAGYYKLASQAMLDGVVAKVDGKEFTLFSDYIRVYSENFTDLSYDNDIIDASDPDFGVTDEVKIHGVTIGGINDGGNKVLISWDPVRKAGSYTVEIVKDGSLYILGDGREGAESFGENYLIVPSEYVTLNDKFTLRIKQNGSLFTPTYYYGYPAVEGREDYYFGTVKEEHYSYLSAVDGIYTSYLRNMEQLGQILRYVAIYSPTGNASIAYSVEKIDGADYNVFTMKLYFDFDLGKAAQKYPSDAKREDVAEEFADLYLAICGAQNAYCPSGIYRYRLGYDGQGGYSVAVLMPVGGTILHTEEVSFTKGTSVNYSETPYGANFSSHAINYRRTQVKVNDGDQLYAAAEKGYLAVAGNDSVRVLYNKILNVVNSIIDAGMTDKEKASAFFDYLTVNVVYDKELEALSASPDADLYRYAGFRPEGVFDDGRAVCDGISKAFVLLCAIEGIPCLRVTGTVNGAAHSWNKVLIDGEWYIVDATHGSLNVDGKLYSNHRYFLISDADYERYDGKVVEYGVYPSATASYDYYRQNEVNGLSLTVTSREDLQNLVNSFGRVTSDVDVEILFDPLYADGQEAISAETAALESVYNKIKSEVIFLSQNRAIITLQKL